ncbi:MAG: hypothetical protein EGR44_10115 [Ruminococcaceae bacterium]|nr:hypothetical protein [Oscillospiraceae bacterium]
MDNEQIKNNVADSVPNFTPPTGDGKSDAIPTFTPPTPTFTPPKNTKPDFNGPACSYHKDEPAVAKCARCGRYICQDCFDNYGVSSGEYAGKALCYDCCQQIVAENVADLKKNKNKIMLQFIVSIIGMVLGMIVGISSGGGVAGAVIGLAVGGVLLSALKVFFSLVWDVIKIAVSGQFGVLTVLSIIWNILVLIVKCLITTVSNTVYYINYLVKTSGFINSDTQALQQMADYMEYTMIRNQNRGVDIDTLLNQKSELADNSYAQMVQQRGEEGAEAAMRECVATFNEHGEIIRNFNVAGRAAA